MVKCHHDEAKLSGQRRASVVGGARRNGEGGGTGGLEGNPTKGMGAGGATGGVKGKPRYMDESRNETAGRLERNRRPTTRYQVQVEHVYATRTANC